MKITILAVGNNVPKWVNDICNEYIKRINKTHHLEIKEIKAEKRHINKNPKQIMSAEAKKINILIPNNYVKIALDEQGETYTTQQFTKYIKSLENNYAAFIIGGADGLDSELKNSCSKTIRLSSLTLPHHLVRLILTEQIYRCWSILNNHPYHRE